MSIKNAISNIGSNIARSAGKFGLQVQAHSPELLVAAGVVTLVGGVVAACVASRKIDKVIDEHKERMDDIHAEEEKENEAIKNEESSEEDAEARKKALKKGVAQDTTYAYFRTGLKFVKLYAPAIALIGLSLTCFLSSNNILQKRNVALSSAFAAVSQEFSDYRGRVAARFGEEVENELHYNLNSDTVETTVTDENGKETKATVTEFSAADKKPGGMYSRYFTAQTSTMYKTNHMYNEDFLKLQQSYFTNMLVSRGHLFLNEVYSDLGLEICDYGQLVGWVYDPHNKKRVGGSDYNYVDLRMQEVYEPIDPNYPDAPRKKCWMIDPNVEGNILDLI